jgi:Zn-dependent protease
VARDDAAPSGFQRLMNASWPLCRAFGVDVRVHWSVALVPVALFGMFVRDFAPAAATWSEAVFGSANVDPQWASATRWAMAWTFALYLTVWTHEMAHVLVGRRFGVSMPTVSLSPFGGLAHPTAPMPDARAERWTALAGPATQFVWAALLAVPYFAFGTGDPLHIDPSHDAPRWPEMLRAFFLLQVAIGAFNLVPAFPLDGGRWLHGLLAERGTPARAATTTAYCGYGFSLAMGLAGLGVVFTFGGGRSALEWLGFVMMAVGVTCFLACRALQREARFVESPYEPAPAWKTGGSEEPWKESLAESERLSRAEERRERRAAEARRHEDAQRRRLQERIDHLLDRINEVGGVENLTPTERRELAEASDLLRRETAEQ